MQIRIKATGAVMTAQEFRAMNSNTSMPQQLTDELLDAFGADVVFAGPQAQPTRYQVAVSDGVEQIGGKWYTKYSVADMDPDARAAVDAKQAAAIRQDRNARLTDSDWTQLSDAPVDQAAWATYRQALRDLSGQPGFPWDITWPSKP